MNCGVANGKPITVDDGSIAFKVRGGDRDGDLLEIDLMLARMAIAEAERISPTRKEEDTDGVQYWHPTPGFVSELSRQLEPLMGYCTPSIAHEVWRAVNDIGETLKKSTDD